MTIFNSTENGTKLEHDESRIGHIAVINSQGNGFFVDLDSKARRELAFELLADQYDVSDDYNPSKLSDVLMLTPKRPKPQVGDLYRVISDDGMTPEWRGNPVVQVTRVFGDGERILVQQPDGTECYWNAPYDSLEGPITPYAALGFKA